MSFILARMTHQQGPVLQYQLGDLDLNQALGHEIEIEFDGNIFCAGCGSGIKKTYGDGYCYPCFSSLARTDSCIIKPHTCHFAKGTCREPEWGNSHCMIEHVVYLALTSGPKVGVTGANRVLERWGDQGAVSAIVLARTPDRLTAGLIEAALANHMPDRTNWRKLITCDPDPIDLLELKSRVTDLVSKKLRQYLTEETKIVKINYPIHRYPDKARSIRLDKHKLVSGRLEGIKGQYLLIDQSALNVRRHSGYQVSIQLYK